VPALVGHVPSGTPDEVVVEVVDELVELDDDDVSAVVGSGVDSDSSSLLSSSLEAGASVVSDSSSLLSSSLEAGASVVSDSSSLPSSLEAGASVVSDSSSLPSSLADGASVVSVVSDSSAVSSSVVVVVEVPLPPLSGMQFSVHPDK
jgi:hypothetical protein